MKHKKEKGKAQRARKSATRRVKAKDKRNEADKKIRRIQCI